MVDPIRFRLSPGSEAQFRASITKNTARLLGRNRHMRMDELMAVYTTVALDTMWTMIWEGNPAATASQFQGYLAECGRRIADGEHAQATPMMEAGHA